MREQFWRMKSSGIKKFSHQQRVGKGGEADKLVILLFVILRTGEQRDEIRESGDGRTS